jgi:DNA helicase-2/ATP-dependent DNA helicase PcrA
VTQQSRRGDQHVYGAKSRFMTRAVMARLQQVAWPPAETAAMAHAAASVSVDVAGRLRAMWD